MSLEIVYDPQQDTSFFADKQIELGGQWFEISTGTDAGRALPEDEQQLNEDAFSVIRHESGLVLAVFDGATSMKPIPELDGVSGARFASHTLKELIESSPADLDAGSLLQTLNEQLGHIFQDFKSVDPADFNSLPTSTATIAQIDVAGNQLRISHVGDSFAVVKYKNDETDILTRDLHRQFNDHVLAEIHTIATTRGITPREAREDPRVRTAIMEMFQDTRNRPDGTGEGIVNGDPHMNSYIDYVSLPLDSIESVLLGSDGLVPPDRDVRKADHRKALFHVAARGGIKALIAQTRAVENHDPDRHIVRYKHGDDATGIYVQLLDAQYTL